MTESRLQVGMSADYLETSKLTNDVGEVHREGVFIGDPLNEDYKVAVDQYAKAIKVIDPEHARIHLGELFQYKHQFTGIANGANLDILFSVPAATFPHLRKFQVKGSDSPFSVSLYEGATTTDDGTELTPFDFNRNTGNTPNTNIFQGPTVSAIGTLLEDETVATGKDTAGSTDGLAVEWDLLPNTKYLMRLTNNAGGALSANIVLIWYE